MRSRASGVVPVVVSLLLCTVVGADVVNGPRDLFSLTLPGAWVLDEQSEGAVAWSGRGQDGSRLNVIAAVSELDPHRPLGPQIIQEAKQSEEFPHARDFVETTALVLGQARPVIRFAWDGPEVQPMQTCTTAFPLGQCVYVVIIMGRPGPSMWSAAEQIVRSIGQPVENPRATGAAEPGAGGPVLGTPPTADGASGEGLPDGWLWKQSPDGMTVQVFEKAQPGAVAEIRVFIGQATSAIQLLHQGFYAPLAGQLQVKGVSASPDNCLASLQFQRTSQGIALRGEALAQLGQGAATIAHVAARADQFADRAKQARQLLVTLAKVGAQGGAAPSRTVLHPTLNADRTAQISVPAGWIVGGMAGLIDATDGDLVQVIVGLHSQLADRSVAARLAAGGLDPTLGGGVFLDYLPPEQAFPAILALLTQPSGTKLSGAQVVNSQRLPDGTSAIFEAKWHEDLRDGRSLDRRGVGYISTQPPLDGFWSYYLSVIIAPPDRLEALLPLLLAVYQSASWTPQFRGEVIGRIRADQAETAEIIASVARRRSESADTSARMWSAVIRGDQGIINEATGERRRISGLDDLRRWMSDDPHLRLDNLRQMTFDEWRTAGF